MATSVGALVTLTSLGGCIQRAWQLRNYVEAEQHSQCANTLECSAPEPTGTPPF